jgi:NAD(P)-dependent dehydrogenase (short-subunit alcohol dehydrogenase family)
VALVTGGQQGIGRAIALALAREGADVVLNYLDDPAASERVAEDIRAAGRRCLVVQGDVSRAGDVAALVDAAERGRWVPVGTLAKRGHLPRSAFLDSPRRWDRVHGVNLGASPPGRGPAARRLGRPGAIVNLASAAAYGRARAASTTWPARPVVGLTRAMAWSWPRTDRVNTPPLTDTAAPAATEAEVQAMARQVPWGAWASLMTAAVAVFWPRRTRATSPAGHPRQRRAPRLTART